MRTIALIGTAATIMSTTKASAAASLPTTMAPGRIGVLISRSSVCFSRSRLICPAVNAGAMKHTRMSWKIDSAEKMDWPMRADALAWPKPKPPPTMPRAFGATTTYTPYVMRARMPR
jgi:hypothetical protein